MDIQYATLETCSAATDTVLVIDVWRSFTTAACAFASGAREVVAVGSPEEALALRERIPGALLMGMGVSVVGPPAEGFDFGNSPTDLLDNDLTDRRLVQCTPNGTRGIVRSVSADRLLAGSFVCAGATVRYIKQHSPAQVTFVRRDPGEVEDQVCADYMSALLSHRAVSVAAALDEIREIGWDRTRELVAEGVATETQGTILMADLDCCLAVDRFDFAMVVERRDGLLVLQPASC